MSKPAYKIIIMGSLGVGRSNIALCFAGKKFTKNMIPQLKIIAIKNYH